MKRKTGHHAIALSTSDFTPSAGVYRIGDGMLGGKGIGLARLNTRLEQLPVAADASKLVRVSVPCTVIVTTELFDRFMAQNRLEPSKLQTLSDQAIQECFDDSQLPEDLSATLRGYLEKATYPLAVRSSSLMEDDRHHGYAGLYRSHMLTNDQSSPAQRLAALENAIKQVFASAYFEDPRAYASRMGHAIEAEKMAVVIQQLVGKRYGDLYYPMLSGVVQSENDYPLPPMRRELGLAAIAMGLGITVVNGERSLRFCPRLPRALPQHASDRDLLDHSQRHFYALELGQSSKSACRPPACLVRLNIADVADNPALHPVIKWVASTWIADEARLRDTVQIPGPRVVTFAPMLKHGRLPLAETLCELIDLGRQLIAGPVEMEFAMDLVDHEEPKADLAILQLRPMAARSHAVPIAIEEDEIKSAFCYSLNALGNVANREMVDVVYVKPDRFDPAQTGIIAEQVARLNAILTQLKRRYVLIGPGRWGSQDPWLGIPVRWRHIGNVGTIVETASDRLHAELSQGAHLFNNLAAAGICYLCVSPRSPDRIDYQWLTDQPSANETEFVAHVQLPRPLLVKVDARTSRGVIVSR